MATRAKNQTSILTGELVEASRAATAGVQVSERVPTMRQIVQTNGALDGSALCGADRETECGAQVRFAEAVCANELPLPLDMAQRDVLSIPAHTL